MPKIKMVVFDMDGVLVSAKSSWDFIHSYFHVNNDENFRRYKRGEIDYKEFMRSDILLWGDTSRSEIESILNKIELHKGAKETISKLRLAGYKTAIISGGISLLADRVMRELGIDHSFSNALLFDENEKLTGEGVQVVTLFNKGIILKQVAAEEGISPNECVAVGDSKYDVYMFKIAGYSIAFNPKDEEVKEEADVIINSEDLRLILPHLIEA
jgi:phosphoserine phosphatase